MRIYHLFIAATLAFGQEEKNACTVSFRAVNVAGQPVPHRVVGFQDAAGVDYASYFQGLRGTVPCSPQPYAYALMRTDVSPRVERYTIGSGQVIAWLPETWLSVATNPNLLIIGDRAGEPTRSLPRNYVWTGRVVPAPAERLWIHFRSAVRTIYSNSEIQAEIDDRGEFRVYGGFLKGAYILYVMNSKGDILHLAPVTIISEIPRQPITISLGYPFPIIVR